MGTRSGAGTPEELEMLLEDAFVVRDPHAVAQLFETRAVLVAGDEATQARGAKKIARLAAAMWEREQTYFAAPLRVLQAHETTLVVAERAINVLRRGSDGRWRYAISLLNNHDTTERRSR